MSSSTARAVHLVGVVLTFNGARWLDRTLASLDLCDELLVVDSGSTDASLDIALGHGARVLSRAWEGTIPQFRFAFEQLPREVDGKPVWIVTLDQDEWLSPELHASLQAALVSPGVIDSREGFEVARLSWYFDRYVRHSGWRPDWLLRAFRLDRVQVRGVLPHEEFHVSGPVRRLSGDVIHHPYADLSEHLAKVDAYSAMAARELRARGKRASVAKAFAHGFGKLLKTYVLKLGFLDGRAGAILAVHAFLSAFHKYLRVAEPNAAAVDAAALPHGGSRRPEVSNPSVKS